MRLKYTFALVAILLIALTNAAENDNLFKTSEKNENNNSHVENIKKYNTKNNITSNKNDENREKFDIDYEDDYNVDYTDEVKNNNDKKNSTNIIPNVEKQLPFDNENTMKKDIPKTIINDNTTKKDILELPPPPPIQPRTNVSRLGKYVNYDDFFGALEYGNDGYNWDPQNRVAPPEPATHNAQGGYVISQQRLEEIRKHFLYWYFDQDATGGPADYQRDIHASMPQVHKNFNFQLPFFGFRFNYTRVSMNGYLEFSDPPEHYTYPLVFPIKDWPKRNDPSFIGIFFSKCRIGRIYATDFDQRNPGVYFRMERDLMTRTDRFGVEVRERVMWDIRDGVVGADTFIPKHVIIVTWKNMSFAGGIDNSLFMTNSFQTIIATDEVYTYAIFNYATINWSAHTEAGGDTTGGEGGVPAFIGFNGGNGTQAYEYKPYSQASVLRDLKGRGFANGFPGRHIFRIDERIMLGTCNKDIDASHLPLVFAPESGNMLGGTVVNITGPCFDKNERVLCHFDTEDVVGHVVDRNRAICVQPFLKAQGYIRLEISVGNERFKWRGKYFVETPATAIDRIFFETHDIYKRAPNEIKISWNKFNLTANLNANVQISLWGYREATIRPELEYIDMIETGIINNGLYTISPGNYRNRDNPKNIDMQFGFLHINLSNPQDFSGLKISPVLWSKPIPLAWYFGPQWERRHGKKWARALCDNWLRTDRFLRNFAAELPLCPCTVEHAVYDKGRYMPDFDCDKDSNPTCLLHKGATHCVRSGQPSPQGSEQQCCYDRYGFLMLSYDQMWGSRPRRNHNVGQMPWNEANKVPTLSTWFHDIRPYYSCCFWQDEQAVGCETFRHERRPSQDCIAYQSPGVAAVFGDPHFVTFDNLHYTFNGMGEFVLARGNDGREKFEVQGRFERVNRNIHGEVQATHLTSVATRGNTSTIIEVRLRPPHAQWRYRLDVFADGRRIYFDRPSLKFQTFHGVTVYTPTYILNQSEVVIMYSSGVGVEVVENNGFMTARVYTPWSYINKTSGLFGNWSFDMQDDFTLPDGRIIGVNLNNFESVHKDYAINWMLADRELPYVGAALFTREFGRTASHYSNKSFIPNFIREPRDFLPSNRSYDIERASELCGESYQCRYDYGMTLNRDMAHFTKNYYDSAVNIKSINEKRVVSCGILETPRFGRKLSFDFTPGARVAFECNEGFVLTGDPRRVCTAEGKWDTPVEGYTECLREVYYTRRTAWIAIGIIIIVIAPIMLCIICGVHCYRRKAMKENPEWKMSLPRSRSGSRTNLRHMNSDVSDTTTDMDLKKGQPYEGTYNTHEPLEGRPNDEFPRKKWDLDDDDFTSSENGSELNHSKIARDIEYIQNTGSTAADKPKQSGRRSLRSTSEIIEEEDPTQQQQQQYLPPPPTADDLLGNGSIHQQQYSPTFSAVEQRNSGASSTDATPRFGGVRVFPQASDAYYSRPAPTPPVTPNIPLTQDVGLPHGANTKSTEV